MTGSRTQGRAIVPSGDLNGHGTVALAKLKYFNPAGSVKDRAGIGWQEYRRIAPGYW